MATPSKVRSGSTFENARRIATALSTLRHFFIILVVSATSLVYVLRPAFATPDKTPILPPHVAELRDAILSAARTGRIEELKTVFDMNGGAPEFGIALGDDPIKALKGYSEDGEGREILAGLIETLEMAPATIPFGNDLENNLVYVWPYLAVRPLDTLTPAEDVDLYRLASVPKATEMHEKKRWTWWRLLIGADGTWLLFKRGE